MSESSADGESKIETILGEWRVLRDEGKTLSVEQLIAANPDLAETLRARFDALAAGKQPSLRSVPPQRYSEFRVLGQGGMGIVYWALDNDLNREVAFKVVRPDAGRSAAPTPVAPIALTRPEVGSPSSQAFESLRARFLQEAWVTAGLEHPGIVPVYEVGRTEGGVPYYTMRFVRGNRTLADALADAAGKPADERLALLDPFLKICDTIRYAHAHGVVHRDLKPANIALGEFGEVVVLDWGLAKMTGEPDTVADTWRTRLQEYRDSAELKTMTSALGTPGYMAPEAALGRVVEVDSKSDVYSLGAILYQVLAGRLPYEFRNFGDLVMKLTHDEAPDATALDPSVPAELSAICAKALARVREARTQSVDALAAEIRGWLARREADRELDAQRGQAKAALDAASGLKGDLRLRQLDRAASACDQVLARRPEDPIAVSLRHDIDRLRALGFEERVSASRRKTARRVAAAAAAFLIVAGAVVGKMIDDRRQDAEQARSAMKSERDAKQEALAQASKERDEKAKALLRVRGLGLAAAAQTQLASHPTLALLLAREAVRLDVAGSAASNALRAAIMESHERAVLRGHGDDVTTAAFSPDGSKIATVAADKTVRVWDASGKELAVLRDHAEAVYTAAFSPDGSNLVTASKDKTARIWDLVGNSKPVVLHGHLDTVCTAAFSPDGTKIVTACDDRTARVWDLAGNQTALLRGHEGPVVTAAFSPDGTKIVTASADATARIWSVAGRTVAPTLRGHTGALWSAAFSPDGTKVVTSSMDRTARVWDLSGNEVADLRGHEAGVRSAEFSPDGATIVTTSFDNTVRVWSGASRLAQLGQFGALSRAAYSPDGTKIVTASTDCIARVWDLSGKELASMRGHEGGLYTAAFSPDGTMVVTSGFDRTARIWDLKGNELAVLSGHADYVWQASFSPDGKRIVTASADGTARVWLVRTEDLLELAETRVTRDFTEEELTLYADLLSDKTKARARAALETGK